MVMPRQCVCQAHAFVPVRSDELPGAKVSPRGGDDSWHTRRLALKKGGQIVALNIWTLYLAARQP